MPDSPLMKGICRSPVATADLFRRTTRVHHDLSFTHFVIASAAKQSSSRAPAGQAGMTLIEMLIVLAIIAVAAGMVSLGIGAATRAPSVESEAQRLAERLQSAADDAMLGDALVAFTAEKSGYGFARYDGKGWQPVGGDALGYHTVPGGMTIRLSVAPPVVLGPEGSGKPMTATITARGQQRVVSYDGLTARVLPAT